jgi:hypothetical protein
MLEPDGKKSLRIARSAEKDIGSLTASTNTRATGSLRLSDIRIHRVNIREWQIPILGLLSALVSHREYFVLPVLRFGFRRPRHHWNKLDITFIIQLLFRLQIHHTMVTI